MAAEQDLVMRELARLTFLVEELRALLTDHISIHTTSAGREPGDYSKGVLSVSHTVMDALDAAGEAEYRLHPARMLALHARAARQLAEQIATAAEAAEMRAND
jgi:hypothetical protein